MHRLRLITEYFASKHLVNKEYNQFLPKIILEEKQHSYHEQPFNHGWENLNIVFNGYFQSYLYFDWNREEILKLFGFQSDGKYLTEDVPVSIHIRRGDYVQLQDKHPVITEGYLANAIDVFKSQNFKDFLVFSDDIPFCKENINDRIYPGVHFKYSEGNNEWQDMELMSNCGGHIISNSTFSWWAAWLNQNPNKIVVTPDEESWFGVNYKHHDVSTLLPKDWVRIKY